MADNYDGSIVIDTEIDREGFEQGAEKLYSAIKNLCGEIKSFGATMGKSMTAAVEAIRGLSQNTEAIYEKLGAGATQATDANARFVSSMNDARQSVSGAARAASAYDSALAKTQKQIDAQKAKLSEYYKQVAEIKASTDEALAQTTTDEQAVTVLEIEEIELQKLNDKYAAQLGTLKELKAEYQRLAAAQAHARQNEDTTPAYNADDVKTVAADIEKAGRAVDGYQAKVDKMRAVGATDSAWQSTRYDIAQATAQLQEYRRNLDALQASGKISPEDYERLSSALDTATAKAQQLSASTKGLSPFREKLQQIGAAALRTAANLAKMPFQVAGKGIKALSNSVSNFIKNSKGARLQANALVKALTSLKRLLITRIKRMFISSIFNSAKESLQTLAKFSDSFNSAMSNIKNSAKQLSGNLAVSMGGLIQAIEPMLTGFINALSRVMTYINAFFALLGGKSTMTVAKKQTDSYKDSLDGAAKSAEELKAQVYGFDELNKRSGNDDKDNGVNDGSDLFEEVPIDSVLPDKLRDLFQELKDLWNDGKYFDFGAKLAEGLNSLMQTADDWINNTLRPKGVEWAANIAEILNGLVDGFDWNLLGKTLADGLNAVFDIVNTFLTKFDFEALGKGIGEAINGWFDNIEWDLIGQTFANGLNAIISTISGIVNNIDWAGVGDGIAEFIRNFFTAVDWDKAAQSISTGVNGIVKAFQHLTDGVDWLKIGQDIGKFLSDSLAGIDWAKLVKSVIDGIVSIEKMILGTIQGFDWGSVGKALADGVNGIDLVEHFRTFTQTLGAALNSVLDFLVQFIENVDWGAYAQKLWDGLIAMLGSIDFASIVSKAFELLGAAVGAATDLFGTLMLNVVEMIIGAIDGIREYFGEYINQCGGDVIAGLLQGILNALLNIGEWIYNNILVPFLDGFKKAFGIASPSTVMAQMGKYIVEGLLQGIKNAWDAVVSYFKTAVESIKTTLTNAWNAVKTTCSTAWENIKNTITTKFEGIKTSISTTAENVKTTISTAWNTLKTNTATAWENLKTTVKTHFDAVKRNITLTANTIKSDLTNLWNNVKQTASMSWDTIKTTVQQKFDGVKQNLSNTANTIKQNMQMLWTQVNSTASSSWMSIQSTITQRFQSIVSALQQAGMNLLNYLQRIWSQIQSSASSLWSSMTSVGSNIVGGIRSGISSAWSSVTSTFSNLGSRFVSGARSLFGIHSPSTVFAEMGEYIDLGLANGIDGYEKTVLKTVNNLANDVTDEFDASDATLRIGAEGDGMVNKLSGITAKLSDIANVFHDINTMLTGMNGLRVPAIATGTEVPYKARIADSSGDVFESRNFTDFSSGVDERLSNVEYRLQQILDRFERFKGIDSDELAAAIAFALRGEVRGFGGA